MAPAPIVTATIQAAVISVISNLLAQAITAQQTNTPFNPNPLPTFQFLLFALLSTPPNFLWQEFLESTFPAYHASPTTAALKSAAASNDAELDDEAAAGTLVEPKLNKLNTVIKTVLDQTLGATVNTLMFSLFMHGIQQAMAHHPVYESGVGVVDGLKGLLGPGAVRYGAVDWARAWAAARGEFWGLLMAGLRFWPLVSVVNYVFLTSVEARSLVGSLAGLAWGVYISLVTGK